ncbi:hypothetical protein FRC03_004120 [Tulasnella sp. 419]|nr:hypothetical protein FRC03_004120 [Tulasnella sp. 419]
MFQSTNFDRRRINGPEKSFLPSFADEDVPSKSHDLRGDRKALDIRPIYLKRGLISQANGSAYIETGQTKIACAVYGPRQAAKNAPYSEHGKLNIDVKFAPFSCHRRRAPLKEAEDRSLAVLIHQSLAPSLRLELFPKSTIDVFVMILENDGVEGCVAAGTVASSAALADAGIEMLGLVTSCSSSIINQELKLDPTSRESLLADGTVTVASIPALGVTTNIWQTGRITPQQAIECMDQCIQRCTDIHHVVAQSLLDGQVTS